MHPCRPVLLAYLFIVKQQYLRNMYRATLASRRPQYGGRVSGLNPAPQPITDYLPKLFIATYAMLSGYWEYAFGIKIGLHNNGLPGEGEI